MEEKNLQLVMTDGEARVSTLVIAEGTDNKHKAVIQLVRKYQADLEEFGSLAFEMAVMREDGRGGQATEYANLNDQQSALIMTYMKNTEVVRTFKKQLVREFYAMSKAQQQTTLTPMQTLELHFAVTKEHDTRLTVLEQTRRLEKWQQVRLRKAVDAKVKEAVAKLDLDGKKTAYSRTWRLVWDKFDVASYSEIPAIVYEEAMQFVAGLTMAQLSGL